MSRLLLLAGLLALAAHSAVAAEQRWYNQQQVEQGKQLFAQNCAACHGANAESTPKWRDKGPDGRYPPPPLNGSAHAWHHPMKILRHTVREGGAPVGGIMPPFKEKLNADQIDAVIAYFQSYWNDEIYALWQKSNKQHTGSKMKPVNQEAKPKRQAISITHHLKIHVKGVNVGTPVVTPIPGMFQVKVGNQYVYMSRDGRYGITGELIDFEKGIYLTEQARNLARINALSAFPEQDMVVYPADGESKAVITIFTDTDCPFCRKLHKEVPALQQAGVKVRYIAFPRSGKQGSGYENLRAVWCEKDRRKAMDIAKGKVIGLLDDGDCKEARAVDAGYQLGIKLGIRGTPYIIFSNGEKVAGYLPAGKILQVLGLKAVKGATK